jgi:hypothetical protein
MTGWRSDPFLRACTPFDRVIDLMPHAIGPISIRDQAVRGHLGAIRAAQQWPPDPSGDNDDAVVVGAGVAGFTAALTLAKKGYRVLIVESEDIPFACQHRSRGRWIDPYFYDWPMCSYEEKSFPARGGLPLSFNAGWAHEIAERWRKTIFDIRPADKIVYTLPNFAGLKSGKAWEEAPLLYANNTRFHRAMFLKDRPFVGFELENTNDGTRFKNACALLILATGFHERLTLPGNGGKYVSPPYWHGESDNWLTEPGKLRDRRIVISGGGDGAIQDLFRIMTGIDDPRRLLDRLLDVFGPKELENQRRALVVHDQAFWRGLVLNHRSDDDKSTHRALDRAHGVLAREAVGQRKSQWEDLLRQYRSDIGWNRIDIVMMNDYLDPLLAFNRYAMRLLLELGTVAPPGTGDPAFTIALEPFEIYAHFGRTIAAVGDTKGSRRVRLSDGLSLDCDHVLVRHGVAHAVVVDPPAVPASKASVRKQRSWMARRSTRSVPPHYVP